jgi:xylulokinase
VGASNDAESNFMSRYVITYDVGTSSIKTCLYDIGDQVTLIASESEGYQLFMLPGGGAEQDPAELWAAMCSTTRRLMADSGGISPQFIEGISFCSQMQSLVLLDSQLRPVRRSMNYMDQRAAVELAKGMGKGPRYLRSLLTAVRISGAAPLSVKDPVWKYNWVKRHEPAHFAQIFKWVDIKEFLIAQCTRRCVMTPDSAFATMLYDGRPGHECFSPELCRMFGVDIGHLPQIVKSTDQVGPLTAEAAKALGLVPGVPVFGGGGDASLIGVGAGAANPGATHVYCGTSGWVSTVVQKRTVDVRAMIATTVGVNPGDLNYFAELETAGKCLEWVRDHLALDEINVYLRDNPADLSVEARLEGLYEFMLEQIKEIPAGSNGVIFTPWLHGNRCPFEDPAAAGTFFNIRMETGKRELIHAVLEGVCYHLRWQLEAEEKKVTTSSSLKFVGGGALAPLTCQLFADITGREVESVDEPQNVGAMGAAILVGVGLGVFSSVHDADRLVRVSHRYHPNPANKAVHDRNFQVFKSLYYRNKKAFHTLNGGN